MKLRTLQVGSVHGERFALRGATVLGLLLLSSCSGGGGEDSSSAAPDTLTRRQRDSIIANSQIPGAGAVGRAMGSADQAAARARAQDSVAASPR